MAYYGRRRGGSGVQTVIVKSYPNGTQVVKPLRNYRRSRPRWY